MSPRPESLEPVRAFVDAVSRRMRVAAAYLAGSHARGDARDGSDYDIILVSPDFEPVRKHWRAQKINDLWDYRTAGVDLLCYTPEEFEDRRHGATIVADMMEYAVRIL